MKEQRANREERSKREERPKRGDLPSMGVDAWNKPPRSPEHLAQLQDEARRKKAGLPPKPHTMVVREREERKEEAGEQE